MLASSRSVGSCWRFLDHDTVEKPPFIMGPKGPIVLHVGYLPATVEEVYFPHAELVGDVGPSLALLADRLEGRLPKAGALLPLREQILADLAPMSRVALARVGVGVVVKEGGSVPDVSTPEKLKAAVLAARSLTYTDPATPNTSGAIAGAALAKLGILDEIKGKTRHASLAVGGELVAKGEVELGFFNLSEIPKGVTVAGALPAPLQGYTVYESAVLSKGSTSEAVTAFVKYLASAAAASHWSGAKLEPAETYMRTRASQ
jgi:hypothetical protein